jgi:hypothetical protein
MKKWGPVLFLPLLMVTVLASGCRSTASVPKIDDVSSAELNLSIPVNQGDPVPQPLDVNVTGDRLVVEKLLGWLSSAEAVRRGQEPLPNLGQHVIAFHLKDGRIVSAGEARDKDQVLFDTGTGEPLHLKSPEFAEWIENGWKQDVKTGVAITLTSVVQLELQAASDSVAAGQSVAFTVTFRNGGMTEVTLMAPCGHPFDLNASADGQEVDNWLRQTYGGPPVCPPGEIKVQPGESYSTSLSLRFPTQGTFSVDAINLGAVSFAAGNVRSNQVAIHVR